MKTLENFKTESNKNRYDSLEDFVLSIEEWKLFEKGTKAIRVKTYSGNSGNLVGQEYVLRNLENTDEILEDMQLVSSGYYTESQNVIHN